MFIRNNEDWKVECVEFALQHWRTHNPDAYIIVTGHGVKPNIEQYCNYLFWPNDIIEKDINVGHPYLVNKGLQHAIDKGFLKVLKSRCDTIHSIPNLINFCEQLLKTF